MPDDPPSAERDKSVDRDLIFDALREVGEEASDSLPPRDVFPGYEILHEIHRGGQGVVFLAIQHATKRKVAVKVLHAGPFIGAAGRARFEREVQVLGQLSHPNIVGIHDSGTTADGSVFYVMDYVAGDSLEAHLFKRERRSIPATLALFAKICDAVNAAHLRGIIHRDLKPANVRVRSDGEPVVVDFGLAKTPMGDGAAEAAVMTVTGQFIGSLPWASPEQATGTAGAVDVRSDVYSLGVILYQLLVGRFPYDVAGNMRDVLDNIQHAEPTPPRSLRPDLDSDLEAIVHKCLEKDREARYQSAGDLARDLKRYMAGEPIEARRHDGWYVLRKLAKRYKGTAFVASVFVVLVLVFAVVMSVLYRRALIAEGQANLSLQAEKAARAEAQRQEERAEWNFGAAWAMGRTLMFDLPALIEDLPGATAARQRIVTEAIEYLESLRLEAEDEPELLLQLAEAYDQVGDLHGALNTASLGDTAEATLAYARARELRESLRPRMENDPRLLAGLGESAFRVGQSYQRERRYASAAAEYARASRLFSSAYEAGGSAVEREREREMEAISKVGEMMRMMARTGDNPATRLIEAATQYAIVEGYWSVRLAANVNDEIAAQKLSVVRDKQADLELERGARLLDEARRLVDDRSAARERFEAAIREFARAADTLGTTADRFRTLAAAQPENSQYLRDQFVALHHLGTAISSAATARASILQLDGLTMTEAQAAVRADREHALVVYRHALEITRFLAAADPLSLERQRDLYLCLNKVGNELRDLGDGPGAMAAFEESYAVRERLLRSDPTPRHLNDAAVGVFKLGSLAKRIADQIEDPERRLTLYRLAIDQLGTALERFRALQAAGALGSEATEPPLVARLIRECEESIAALRTGGGGTDAGRPMSGDFPGETLNEAGGLW
ncbi:MAG: protein kinase [Phycisphaeraceae bacterium]|nr:protein kinase [Phycisphaeraceae bacterium]